MPEITMVPSLLHHSKGHDPVYVLHVFKKKSHKGGETPEPDLNVIKVRLKQAQQEHEKWLKAKK
jgi:phage-related protein